MAIDHFINSDLDFLRLENEKKPVNPPGKSIAAYVEGKRILPADTPFPGFWNNSKTPYLVEPMECMSPYSPIRHLAIMKGAQLGYTAGPCENAIAYWMDENPSPILVMSATEELLIEWAGVRIEPLIDSCGFRHKIHTQTENAKSRKSGDNTKFKQFRGGWLSLASAQSPGKMRNKSVRILIRDEIDGAPKYLKTGEGNWLDVSGARTDAWDYRKKILDISTPKMAHDSNIKDAFDLGDQRKYQIKCPYCGTEQFLEFGNEKSKHGLKGVFDADGRVVDAYYSCKKEECTKWILNHQKTEFLKPEHGAKWVATSKSYDEFYRSYHMSTLYSPVGMLSWRDLFSKWQKSKMKPEDSVTFRNLYMGLPFVESGERPDSGKVYSLRGAYLAGTVPDYILYLTCAIDVQRGSANNAKNNERIELEIMGHGAGFRSASIIYLTFEGDVTDASGGAWQLLTEYADKTGLLYKRKDGEEFYPRITFIDSNDHYSTAAVYDFCKLWENTYPIKGYGGQELRKRKKEEGDPVTGSNFKRYRLAKSGDKSGGVSFYEISTNYYKRNLYNQLRKERQDTEPQLTGFCDFPQDYTGEYFDMLTAEDQMMDGSFHAGGRRNEALDCRVYNMCAGDVYLDGLVGDYKAEAKALGASMEDLLEINHLYILNDLKESILPQNA